MDVAAGDRVSLYCGNSWEWIVAYYAAAKAGAAINPINVMLTPEEVKFVTRDCQARIILSSADKGEALLAVQKDTPLEYVILFGDDAKGGKSFDELISRGRDAYEAKPIAAAATSTIGYTSGTTGQPKGAMTSYRAVLLNSSMVANGWVFTAADTAVSALPCSHVYGNVVMNGTFLTGGTLLLMPRFDAERTLGHIGEHRATHFHGVPTMHMYILNTPTHTRYDLSSLTRCTVGGQTMPVSKIEEAQDRYGCPLLEIWGMTEIAGAGTMHPFYGDNRLGSIGLPITYADCRVADVTDAAKTLPDGETGELMLRGPIVMQGYFGNERATKETIEPDGWLHSGDIARRDQDGYYYIVDRKKDMINTAGFKVYPAEISGCLPRIHQSPWWRLAASPTRSRVKSQRPMSCSASAPSVTPMHSWRIAANSSRPTRCRAPSSSSPICRKPAPARSSAANSKNSTNKTRAEARTLRQLNLHRVDPWSRIASKLAWTASQFC